MFARLSIVLHPPPLLPPHRALKEYYSLWKKVSFRLKSIFEICPPLPKFRRPLCNTPLTPMVFEELQSTKYLSHLSTWYKHPKIAIIFIRKKKKEKRKIFQTRLKILKNIGTCRNEINYEILDEKLLNATFSIEDNPNLFSFLIFLQKFSHFYVQLSRDNATCRCVAASINGLATISLLSVRWSKVIKLCGKYCH